MPFLRHAIAFLALLSLLGCEKKEPPKLPPPTVTVAPPARKTVAVYGDYVGRVDSPQTVELRARVQGFLKEIHFKEGQEVEKGALMFVIDPDYYQVALQKAKAQMMTAEAALLQARNVKDVDVDKANLAKAEAELTNANQNLADMKIAVDANALARSQLDNAVARQKEAAASVAGCRAKLIQSEADYHTRTAQAEAGVATAKSAVAEAELNLSYTRICSPVKGRVGLAYNKIGSLVGHSDPTLLATVSLVDPVYANFTVSEREVFELRRLGRVVDGGLTVTMDLEDGKPYAHEGRINFTDRALDPGTGTLSMRAEFPNPDGFLRPGNYAKVKMVLTERRDALVVAERALGVDQGGAFVLVVDAKTNVVEHRAVKIGPKTGGLVVIEEGLQPDELVVIKGLQKARPGSVVNPVREDKSVLAASGSPAKP